MVNIFQNERVYILGDEELSVIGTREKLAQWRFRNVGPPWLTIGRRIAYAGCDLNAWLAENRTDPNAT